MDDQRVNQKSNVKRIKIDEEYFSKEKVMTENQAKKIKTNESDSKSNKISQEEFSLEVNPNVCGENSSTKVDFKVCDPEEKIPKGNSSKESSTEKVLEDKNVIEENHFYNLFMDVLDIFHKYVPVEEALIQEALMNIKKSFTGHNFNSIDFNSTEYLIAYFKHYSTLNAAVSRHRFLNAINNKEKLKTYVNQPILKIISLGGGPGTDMVGFCSALQECRKDPVKLLNLCVVDKWKRWESFNDIIKMLLREKNYGNASTVFQKSKMFTTFMEVDLNEENPTQEYNSAVNSANIVLLARVLDSLNFKEVSPQNMFDKIAGRMKTGAVLFLVDSKAKGYHNELLKRIYISDPELENFQIKIKNFYHPSESNAQIAVFWKKH